MGGKGGGKSSPQTQYVKTETSNLPEYARPYFEDMMSRAQGTTVGAQYQPYQDAQGNPLQRIADFNSTQKAQMQNQINTQAPSQYGTGTALATAAGLGSLNAANYQTGQFGYDKVRGMQQQSPEMQAAQTGYNPSIENNTTQAAQSGYQPNLQNYSMQAAQGDFGGVMGGIKDNQMAQDQSFGKAQADQYMSPYQQAVTDITKREAQRDAKMSQLSGDLGSARQGTYGGSRAMLAGLNRERALGQNLADIQTKGQQSAYENAQQQFERDRSSRTDIGKTNLASLNQTQQLRADTGMKGALANLDAQSQANVQNLAAQLQTQGLGADQSMKMALANMENQQRTGEQNLASRNTAQQLRTDTGLKTSLANLDARQQAAVQNQAAKLQTQGLNADQAMKAALANQTAGMDTQKMREQSRQFGAGQALQGYAQAGNQAQTLANLGQGQFQTEQALRDKGFAMSTLEQEMQQRGLDQKYADFIRQQDFPLEMLQQYSSLLRGVPVSPNTTETGKAPNPSIGQQILGTGIGALGAYNSLRG